MRGYAASTVIYDGQSRVATNTQAGATTNYTYDGSSLRVRKCAPNCSSPTSSTVYIFSGSKVIPEYDNGAVVGSPSREYIYSGSQLLAKIEPGAASYYHPDLLSARVTTNSTGTSIAEQGHYPFGESWYASGTTTKWTFTSYERDAESGNDYAMARYHVNRLGRFSSPDLIAGFMANPQSLNRFAYAFEDPINLVDPSGLFATNFYCLRSGEGGGWLCYYLPTDGRVRRRIVFTLDDEGGGDGKSPPPECFARLKYRPTEIKVRNHSFWWIQDRTGTQYIISGGPTGPAGTGHLNVWVDPGATGTHFPKDNASAATWLDSGLSADNCDSVDKLLAAAKGWKQGTIRYWPWGPNSNTAPRYFGEVSSLFPTPPPDTTGWDAQLTPYP